MVALALGSLAVGSLSGCAALVDLPPVAAVARALRIASAATSHTLCASTFFSGLDPEQVWQREVRPEPGMGLVAGALDWQMDTQRRAVRTSLAGRVASRAVFRPGEGC